MLLVWRSDAAPTEEGLNQSVLDVQTRTESGVVRIPCRNGAHHLSSEKAPSRGFFLARDQTIKHYVQPCTLRLCTMRRFAFFLVLAPVLLSACQQTAIKPATSVAGCEVVSPVSRKPKFQLQPIDSGLPLQGQWREGFELGDINGDGHLDLVHGPARKGNFQPNVFLGDGQGHFRRDANAHWPPLPYDYGDVALADFNRDGLLDVAISAHLRGLAVLINEGRQSFAPWGQGLPMTLPAAAPDQPLFGSRAIAAVDWNQDGMVDLLATNEGPTMYAMDRAKSEALRLYLNRGGFFELSDVSQIVNAWGSAIAVGDVTGDRWPEVITGSQRYGNRKLLHIGFGSAPSSQALNSLPDRLAVFATHLAPLRAGQPNSMLFGAHVMPPDLKDCSVLLATDFNTGQSDSTTPLFAEPGQNWVTDLQSADFNGDGQRELVALHRYGQIRVLSQQDSHWQTTLLAEVPATVNGCNGAHLELADLDHDGQPEVLASYAGEDAPANQGACASAGGLLAFRLTPVR